MKTPSTHATCQPGALVSHSNMLYLIIASSTHGVHDNVLSDAIMYQEVSRVALGSSQPTVTRLWDENMLDVEMNRSTLRVLWCPAQAPP